MRNVEIIGEGVDNADTPGGVKIPKDMSPIERRVGHACKIAKLKVKIRRKEGTLMGAGRKPKPTAMKELEGNPGKRKLNKKEPMPGKGMPDCPKWLLPDAQEEWKRLCEKLSQMGVLTEIDRSAFAAYCQSYARWKEAQDHINSEGATYETENGMQRPNPWVAICNTEQRLMMQAASEFGLTPSARSRIMAASGVGKDDEDEMESLLGGDS